jgi:hypothetical protein
MIVTVVAYFKVLFQRSQWGSEKKQKNRTIGAPDRIRIWHLPIKTYESGANLHDAGFLIEY